MEPTNQPSLPENTPETASGPVAQPELGPITEPTAATTSPPAQPVAPVPAPAQPAATPPAAAAPTPTVATPATADDVDVIEKEWVDAAQDVVKQHGDDPHTEEEGFETLQVDYLKKRYGKDIKKPSE